MSHDQLSHNSLHIIGVYYFWTILPKKENPKINKLSEIRGSIFFWGNLYVYSTDKDWYSFLWFHFAVQKQMTKLCWNTLTWNLGLGPGLWIYFGWSLVVVKCTPESSLLKGGVTFKWNKCLWWCVSKPNLVKHFGHNSPFNKYLFLWSQFSFHELLSGKWVTLISKYASFMPKKFFFVYFNFTLQKQMNKSRWNLP